MGDIIKITHENYMLMKILKLHSSKSLETELLIFYIKKKRTFLAHIIVWKFLIFGMASSLEH